MRVLRIMVLATAGMLGLAACSSPGVPRGGRHFPTTSTSAPSAGTSSTTEQTTGARTVLAPVGLNIRAQPSTAAPVVRTAAQGAVLTVLAHTAQGGGWFQVRGPTVSGWITDNPTLSAPGTFTSYSSTTHQVSLFYPEGWTAAEATPTTVVFHPASGGDTVAVTTATTVDQLGRGRAGYTESDSTQVVVCGITTNLVTYTLQGTPPASGLPSGVTAGHFLAQVRVTLDPQHALGLDANTADPSGLEMFRAIVSSVTFPFPQCQGAGS